MNKIEDQVGSAAWETAPVWCRIAIVAMEQALQDCDMLARRKMNGDPSWLNIRRFCQQAGINSEKGVLKLRAEIVEHQQANDAQRALDAEREKVKELVANQAEYEKCTDEQITALNQGCLDYEKQLATLQAQLRQAEGQSKQQAEEAVIVFAKYTTLRQLLEDVLHTFGYLRFHRVAGMDGLLYETHNKMSPERTVEACEKRIRAALAAQDAGAKLPAWVNEAMRLAPTQTNPPHPIEQALTTARQEALREASDLIKLMPMLTAHNVAAVLDRLAREGVKG